MFSTRRNRYSALAITVVGVLSIILIAVLGNQTASIAGIVVGEDGVPIKGATVRIQATKNSTITGSDGTFTLTGLESGVEVTVSGWKEYYYCVKEEHVVPPSEGIKLVLRLYQTDDNPDFEWTLPISDDPDVASCASCKADVTAIWLTNAHAGSGTNPRFFSMYNGTDTTGTLSIAPGYAQDFPGTAGVCATCHAPGAAIDAPYTTNMNELSSADTFGVHCDVCHKAAGVYMNPATSLPYDNVPGVLSMDVRRPWPGTDRYELFFGTFDDDNVPEEDTKLSLIAESQFCASCHQFSFWGTPIYQSYREWLESPY
ncbi:carboxypeptidase regulatory-like domain-containing protein, partial [Candidatus Bipolaricaulota bacterium]|nr:carboxypeptidase regulatory-like domain-containing protein [Candidatus Bipolaricaulota bacterium]